MVLASGLALVLELEQGLGLALVQVLVQALVLALVPALGLVMGLVSVLYMLRRGLQRQRSTADRP